MKLKTVLTVSLLSLMLTGAADAQFQFPVFLRVPSQFPTIQAAVDAAQNGWVVFVDPGTYEEEVDFKGKAIQVISTKGPFQTTIRGSSVFNEPNRRCVLFRMGEGPDSLLSGFTLSRGHAPRALPNTGAQGASGGGIFCFGASPTIRNCIFDQCRASGGAGGSPSGPGGHGGGLAAFGILGGAFASPRIVNCVFKFCYAGSEGTGDGGFAAGGHGGAIYLRRSAAKIINCTMTGNLAGTSGLAPGTGGAIYLDIDTVSVDITNTIFWKNKGGTFIASNIAPAPLNDFFPPTPTGVTFCTLSTSAFASNIVVDPDFVPFDVARIDYDSPCVDAGTPVSPDLLGALDVEYQTRVAQGGIDIGADEVQAPLFPGTGEDLVMRTSRDAFTLLIADVPYFGNKQFPENTAFELTLESSNGFHAGDPIALIVQRYLTGSQPASPFTAIHINPTVFPEPILLVGGNSPFGVVLTEGESIFNFQTPPGTSGWSLLFQAFITTSNSNNGIFVSSDAHTIDITE